MGCDIHWYTERKIDGVWIYQEKTVDEKIGNYEYKTNYYSYDERNYDTFSMLANVRNGWGFAGVRTGDGFNFISEPRGLPDDASEKVKEEADGWGPDGHSHTHLTLKEILDFDWDQGTTKAGVLTQEQYEAWDKSKGSPDSWCGGMSGPDLVTYNEFEYVAKKIMGNLPAGKTFAISVRWQIKYREVARYFLETFVPRLQELDIDPENVRGVFWFDN